MMWVFPVWAEDTVALVRSLPKLCTLFVKPKILTLSMTVMFAVCSAGGVREGQNEALAQEEGEEDISGTQFVCETVIRSLTLEEAPDHKTRPFSLEHGNDLPNVSAESKLFVFHN